MDIDLKEFRKKYPQYNKVPDDKLLNAIELKHSKEGVPESEKGWVGIKGDIERSVNELPDAISDFVSSIPKGMKNVGNYALSHNPGETLGNIGAGGVESAAGLLSAPQVAAQYLGNKFPALREKLALNREGRRTNDKSQTIHEMLMDFEKRHGLQSRSEEEGSVRNLGGLLFGGKALSKLGSPTAGTLAIAGEQAGRGGDPLHAAILGSLGHVAAKAPLKNMPSSAVEAVKNAPEILGQGAASALETAADVGSKLHIPGVQPTLGALSSYLKHKSVSPEKFATKQLLGDIKPEDLPMIEERVNAARRLGLSYLTPAEALLSPYEAAKQGTVGRTSSGSKLLFEKGKERTKSEETAIDNLLDTIHNEERLGPEMQEAYHKTMARNVPDDFVERHSSDPLIEHAMKELDNNPVYKKGLGNISKNSFEYWDHVKRVLSDMEENEVSRKPYKASVIGNTRRAMVHEMDQIAPEYERARNISEREFTRKKIEKFFDKRDMTGNNFHKFLRSRKEFNQLINKLNDFPEAQQKLRDMKLLFGDLIPNDMSIRSATALKRTGMSESRNKLDALKQALDEKYGQQHDVASVNLMTNPRLLEIIKQHLNK